MAALIALFINVILRYGFNYSLAWSEELVREVIIVTTFIGCSAATKVRAMVKVDALIQLVPVTKYPLMFFANLVTLLFSGMMIYYGWKLVLMQAATEQVTILLQIPLELLYSVLPIMGIMMFIRTLMVMHQDWQAWQQTRVTKPA
jgi:C4-dicarboxylate transporter DctQ subunit